MKTKPFFRLPPTEPETSATRPPRAPYHDDTDCPIGQSVLRGGQWQYYEPGQVADTRIRCPLCLELGRRPEAAGHPQPAGPGS